MDSQSVDVFKPVMTDVIVFCSLGLFDLYTAKILKPYRRGFFCDDETIRYPHYESTVPSIALNIVGTVVPILLVFIFEYREYRRSKKLSSSYYIGRYKISPYYWSIYEKLICFGSGALFTMLITDIGKKTIGRLRPNFLDVCKADLDRLCRPGVNTYQYIMKYECAVDDSIVDESRVSFPSGHSSFAFYVAVFVVLYLQKRFKTRAFFLKPAIQFLVLLLAWFVALSRVMNNKHHWSDVLVGIFIGSAVAIVNTVLVYSMNEEKTVIAVNPNTINGNRTNGTTHEAHEQL